MRATLASLFVLATALPATAAEIIVQNDSLTDFDTAVIVTGFIAGEKAAVWLESPCNGTLVGTQVFWRSESGATGQSIEGAIEVYGAGDFPEPGPTLKVLKGPVLVDGVLNEYRFLMPDPILVSTGEDFAIAFEFVKAPPAGSGPSVVRDANGIHAGRNAIFATPTNSWHASESLGLTGDFVMRGIVDCDLTQQMVDIVVSQFAVPDSYSAGQPLGLSLTVTNQGPDDAQSIGLVDVFPPQFEAVSWICTPVGGAICPPDGSGNVLQSVALPAGSGLEFSVTTTISAGTTGTLSNTWSAVVGGSGVDSDLDNNTSSLSLAPAVTNLVFSNGFDPEP